MVIVWILDYLCLFHIVKLHSGQTRVDIYNWRGTLMSSRPCTPTNIKQGRRFFIWRTPIIKLICHNEQTPGDWKCTLVCLFKKKGNRCDTDNYRRISLLPVSYKVISHGVLNRAWPQSKLNIRSVNIEQFLYQTDNVNPGKILNLKLIRRHPHIIREKLKYVHYTFVEMNITYDIVILNLCIKFWDNK